MLVKGATGVQNSHQLSQVMRGQTKATTIKQLMERNATSDLICDQFDFSVDLPTMFGGVPVNTVDINATNADVSKTVSAAEEFEIKKHLVLCKTKWK